MGPQVQEFDESALIRRAKTGDRVAQGQLYEHYVDAVYRYMLYRTGNHQTAEDLTAEVFSQMLTAIERYEDRGVPFGVWLFRIARARLVDHWRLNKRQQDQVINFSDDVEEFLIGTEAPDLRHEYADLIQALGYLTAAERELILLRFASGMNNQDIAMVVHSNPNAVKSMMYRALRKLRGILSNQEQFYNDVEDDDE